MKIDHVAMYVHDLENVKDFFMHYFNATCNELYHNSRTGFYSYFLSFGDGSRLEIMTRPDLIASGKSAYRMGFIHLAVSLGGKEKVDELTERLLADGYQMFSAPRTSGDGYYESCFYGPEDNLIELLA